MTEKYTNIVLDTTYILPLYGIMVDQINTLNQDLSRLFKGIYPSLHLYLSSISTLEALQQVIKEYKRQKNPEILNRYSIATDTLAANKYMTILDPLLSKKMNSLAMRLLLTGHSDIYDCLIAGCALSIDSIFVTEDKPLKKRIVELSGFENQIALTWNQFRKKFL